MLFKLHFATLDLPPLPKGDENAKKYQVWGTIWVHSHHCRSFQRYFKRSEIPTRNCFKGSAHEKIKYFGRLFHLFNCLSKGKQSKGRAEKKRQTHGQTMQCSKFPTTKNCWFHSTQTVPNFTFIILAEGWSPSSFFCCVVPLQ